MQLHGSSRSRKGASRELSPLQIHSLGMVVIPPIHSNLIWQKDVCMTEACGGWGGDTEINKSGGGTQRNTRGSLISEVELYAAPGGSTGCIADPETERSEVKPWRLRLFLRALNVASQQFLEKSRSFRTTGGKYCSRLEIRVNQNLQVCRGRPRGGPE